jgi:SAM-dependent methyltransferase
LAASPPAFGLNVGCGNDRRPGWVNVDLPDFDAGSRPWPWPDDHFFRVYAGCLLPHLAPSTGAEEDPLHVAITEAYRVLAPGGVFEVTAPDPRSTREALAAVHHYRLISPTTFTGYLATNSSGQKRGVKYASGGPFESMRVSWGEHGTSRDDKAGRPLGVSRILPDLMPLGTYKLGVFTHVFRRLRLTWLLRGDKIRIVLRKPGVAA